ncbi:MAG: DUF1616 domain-containing protein, partial [Chloroflexota bacterium]
FCLVFFVLAATAAACYRRHSLPPEERYQPQLRAILSGAVLSWRLQSRWDKMLTGALILAIVVTMGAMAYVVAASLGAERFTEFYILGPSGKAEDYPRKVALGDEVRVKVGVVNTERQPVVYHVAIASGGERIRDISPISLEHGQRWEEDIGFQPTRAGQDQKIAFLLYKGEAREPYRSLHLWLDVQGPP